MAIVAKPPKGQTLVRTGVVPVSQALAAVEAKRQVDRMRFRTCCADPRASK